MKKKGTIILAIVLLVISMIFMGIFTWWATTSYVKGVLFGFIACAAASFICSMIFFSNSSDN